MRADDSLGAGDLLKPLGVFVAVLVVVLAGTAVAATLAGSGAAGSPDSRAVDGQSPSQYQPDRIVAEPDPEDGEVTVDSGEPKRVLVDTRHSNQFSTADLDPLLEALTSAGHTVDVGVPADRGGGGLGDSGYANATLQQYDAILVIAPTGVFSTREVDALETYVDGGGRVAVLGEPTQFAGGSGFGESSSAVRASADNLATSFGVRVGADTLYNLADARNDNNYESIYATPSESDVLLRGVERLQFDAAGYLHRTGASDAEMLASAVEGTRTLGRDRTGDYPVVARNGGFVLVADASFVSASELYDADNELFVSNLLTFLVSGDKPDDVPSTPEPEEDEPGSGSGGSGGSDGF